MTVLRRDGAPDHVPWAPLIDGYYMSARPTGMDILDAFREVEADIMERHVWTYRVNMNLPTDPGAVERFMSEGEVTFEVGDIRVHLKMEPHPKGRLLTKTYEIPGRTLTESGLFTAQSPYLPFPVEPLLKTVEDLEAYEYVIKRRRFEPNYESFVQEDERIGDEGIATDSGLTSPIQELLQHAIGIESFYTTFYTDHLPELESLMDAMHESNLAGYELMAASPAEVVVDYENTSTSFISPTIHRKYVSPCINDYADVLHERGKIFLTHRCGLLKALVDAIRDEHDDGVVDISPEPTGDLPLWEAREAWPDKVVLGGFDATYLTNWTPDKIREYAKT
ncbi:hypothetical protein KJ567_04470, partial [Candidatus Bipolaricaulota bacterium]|nr:hypothetical protein [Candidatus Bipolaricaulota bacterium]